MDCVVKSKAQIYQTRKFWTNKFNALADDKSCVHVTFKCCFFLRRVETLLEMGLPAFSVFFFFTCCQEPSALGYLICKFGQDQYFVPLKSKLNHWISIPFVYLPLHHTTLTLKTNLKKKAFENIVGRGENAGNQHFLIFTHCFLLIPPRSSILESHLFCHLQMFSIWTSLKFCRSVMS